MAKAACVGWQLRQRLDWRHTLPLLQHYDVVAVVTGLQSKRIRRHREGAGARSTDGEATLSQLCALGGPLALTASWMKKRKFSGYSARTGAFGRLSAEQICGKQLATAGRSGGHCNSRHPAVTACRHALLHCA